MDFRENWIDPVLDGAGGGYGKFKGLTIRELSQTFATIAEDPNMRSVSAVLRICREQQEIRSHLSVGPQAAMVLGGIAAVLGIAMVFQPDAIRQVMIRAVVICLVLFIGFLSGYLSTAKMARAAVAQERAIGDLTLDTLQQIVSDPTFTPKPLDSIQQQTLKKLLKKAQNIDSRVTALLNL